MPPGRVLKNATRMRPVSLKISQIQMQVRRGQLGGVLTKATGAVALQPGSLPKQVVKARKCLSKHGNALRALGPLLLLHTSPVPMGCWTQPSLVAPPMPHGNQGVWVLPGCAAHQVVPLKQLWGGLAACL